MGEVVEFPAGKIRRNILTRSDLTEDHPKLDAQYLETIGCATVVHDPQPSSDSEPA